MRTAPLRTNAASANCKISLANVACKRISWVASIRSSSPCRSWTWPCFALLLYAPNRKVSFGCCFWWCEDWHLFIIACRGCMILVSMKIAPGEPVPPGFEDEVKAVSQLQPTLDDCKRHALVAVEYIVELTNDTGRDPSYLCVLCDKRGNSAATILSHLISYNHRLKFLVM